MEGVVYLGSNLGNDMYEEFENDDDFYNLLTNWAPDINKGYESSNDDEDNYFNGETCCNSRYTVSGYFLIIYWLLSILTVSLANHHFYD